MNYSIYEIYIYREREGERGRLVQRRPGIAKLGFMYSRKNIFPQEKR